MVATAKNVSADMKTAKWIIIVTKSGIENHVPTTRTDNSDVVGLITEPIMKISTAEKCHELYTNFSPFLVLIII